MGCWGENQDTATAAGHEVFMSGKELNWACIQKLGNDQMQIQTFRSKSPLRIQDAYKKRRMPVRLGCYFSDLCGLGIITAPVRLPLPPSLFPPSAL